MCCTTTQPNVILRIMKFSFNFQMLESFRMVKFIINNMNIDHGNIKGIVFISINYFQQTYYTGL